MGKYIKYKSTVETLEEEGIIFKKRGSKVHVISPEDVKVRVELNKAEMEELIKELQTLTDSL